jgi:CubicO group peptidase (beta-lactamase class C family)
MVPATALDGELMGAGLLRAAELPRLHALLVARHGSIVAERRFRGPALDAPTNVKSVSKSILSALVGIAIAEGKLRGVDQPIAPFFPKDAARTSDPRLARVTVGDLLTMRSGLARTSGESYGPWVGSRNWVAHILRQPLIADPGSTMIYSTGNSHLLSAILTRATRMTTHAYARSRLARPLGIELPPWERDPQGIFLGGNQMRVSARALVRIGELFRNGGRHGERQVVPESWVRESLLPRTRSIFSGQLYGYGWFLTKVREHPAFYAWGYGGQFIFVIPDLALTVVTTSATERPRDFAHLSAIHELLRDYIVPAAEAADAAASASAPAEAASATAF